MEEPSSSKEGFSLNTAGNCLCRVATLVRSHINGLLLFEKTIGQTMPQPQNSNCSCNNHENGNSFRKLRLQKVKGEGTFVMYC